MGISIVLADDHPVVRRGMRAALEGDARLSVIGEAGDGLEAVSLVERLQPDVLLLDLMMPGLNGLEVLTIVPKRSPHTRVVVLSMHNSSAFAAEALMNGATAYVLKGSSEEDLSQAILEACEGKQFLSPPLTEAAVAAYLEKSKGGPFDPHATLTAREREVLQLAAEGKTNAEMAASLQLSPRTVESHRATLMRKLGLKNPADLVRYALRRGLIPSDEN